VTIAEAIQQIEIENVLMIRAQMAELFKDNAEAERLRDQYRERLKEILENLGTETPLPTAKSQAPGTAPAGRTAARAAEVKPLKRSLLFVIFTALAMAQNSNGQNTVSVKVGTKVWTFNLPTSVSLLTCDKASLSPGELSTCTVTLDSPASATGFTIVPYSADAPLILNPTTLTVPANTTVIKLTVTRP
jgi:hypothetical protein